MLPVPSGNDLSINEDWSNENSGLLNEMKTFKKENDELVDLLNQNLKKVKNQQYNIRILLSVAQLCRHNLNFLAELHTIDSLLKISSGEASANQAKAISYIDQALDRIQIIKQQRDDLLTSTTELWNRDWFPRVSEANGRIFLDQVDDIKDHLPVRTVDMSYLIYRELHFPLGKWAEDVRNSRNQFAKENQLPERTEVIDF
jgi:hexosaminidase